MGYFEHPKFKTILQIFEAFMRVGQPICIDRHERLWITITDIERENAGCGSCKNAYDSIRIEGTAVKKSKCCNVPNGVPRSRENCILYIKQYDAHPCFPFTDPSEYQSHLEKRTNDCTFLLDCSFIGKYYHFGDYKWYAYRQFDHWNDLIRQYHLLISRSVVNVTTGLALPH
jgi:hypothetical protein